MFRTTDFTPWHFFILIASKIRRREPLVVTKVQSSWPRMRYIMRKQNISISGVRDRVVKGMVTMEKVPMANNPTDMLLRLVPLAKSKHWLALSPFELPRWSWWCFIPYFLHRVRSHKLTSVCHWFRHLGGGLMWSLLVVRARGFVAFGITLF